MEKELFYLIIFSAVLSDNLIAIKKLSIIFLLPPERRLNEKGAFKFKR